MEDDLRDGVLVLLRMATDDGTRVSLDELIEEFGYVRAELEAELDADIAEVWAVGARAASEVHAEVEEQLSDLGNTPQTVALREIAASLGRITRPPHISTEPAPPEPLPFWLVKTLTNVVGLEQTEVDTLTYEQATARLNAHWSTPPPS